MISFKFTPSTLLVSGCGLLLLLGLSSWLVILGNQQALQESVIALQAIHPASTGSLPSSPPLFASVWEAPLFSHLLTLLQALPWLAQCLWVLGLLGGFFALETLVTLFLTPTPQRRFWLLLVVVGSLWGYWQLATLNFQTYATVLVLLVCWGLLTWLKAKTAPIKGDAPPPWHPLWFDGLVGCGFSVIAYDLGWGIVLLVLTATVFRHQQLSTALPATWQVRSIATLRWVWIGLLVGFVLEAVILYGLTGEGMGLPCLRIPPTLPEWTGWQTSLHHSGLRVISLVGAFFPWGLWLLTALIDLWFNVQKGGANVSFFLETTRRPLRLLSLIGIVSSLLWVIFPVFWVGWSLFLLSHALVLSEWLMGADTLATNTARFNRGFLWCSVLLIALGLLGLVWQNHALSFQLNHAPFKQQIVLTCHSLWCVLGGCIGLLLLWRKTINPKRGSIGLAGWFMGWMLLQTIGVLPLFAEQGENRSEIEAVIQPQWGVPASTNTVSICLDAVALEQGVFSKILGTTPLEAPTTGANPIVYKPLASSACLALEPSSSPTTKGWLLMPESLYYQHKSSHPTWQPPFMGMTLNTHPLAFSSKSLTLLQPLLLPFMVFHQETWVLIPVL